ncbi:EVE domain-containing protein [Rhizobium sp. CB3090]|uniref:EVE domain-containing protein n=1 Tax=Rhizobium sp. CB3090 TaxID=3039156 RepID=UPI0024B1EFBB|nr:EVE domain-containing protein [Rhizobium sp. CB3090]WFU07692.1 EVE domain-containing protein [Rhizobium sp. CB3090]
MIFKASNRNDAALFPREETISEGATVRLLPHANVSREGPKPAAKSYWLAVASAEHVRLGREHGFMQVCHGKPGPLKRIKPGDGIVYYSPSLTMGGRDGFQSFTAIGYVREGEVYRAQMDCGKAYRRDVDWLDAPEQPLRPLLGWLDFTQDKNWGYRLRFGLVDFGQSDFEFLQEIMTSELEVVKQRRLQA